MGGDKGAAKWGTGFASLGDGGRGWEWVAGRIRTNLGHTCPKVVGIRATRKASLVELPGYKHRRITQTCRHIQR